MYVCMYAHCRHGSTHDTLKSQAEKQEGRTLKTWCHSMPFWLILQMWHKDLYEKELGHKCKQVGFKALP